MKTLSGSLLVGEDHFAETSLVAEASWAQEHWMPYMGITYQASDIVQVNIPELSGIPTKDAFSQSSRQDGSVVCARIASQRLFSRATNTSDVTEMIQKAVGTGFSDELRGLMQKGAEIENSLHSLCFEAASERDDHRQKELFAQAGQIDTIHQHIIERSDAVEALVIVVQRFDAVRNVRKLAA